MAYSQIDFDDEENKIIEKYSKIWSSNKARTVKRIVKEFEEKKK